MKKIILSVLLCSLCFTAAKVCEAISVYPYSVDFDASSKKRVISVDVTNSSNERKTYRVSVIDMKQGITGGYTEFPAGVVPADSAVPFISFSPRQFTLGPNEYQRVNISRKPMLDAPDGEYIARLKFQEIDTPTPKEQTEDQAFSAAVQFRYNLTIPIYIKKGETKGTINITSAKLEEKGGKHFLVVTLLREEGSKYFRGKITATLGKQSVSEVQSIRIAPSTPERRVSMPLNKGITAKDLAGKKIRIVYRSDSGKEKGVFSEAEFIL